MREITRTLTIRIPLLAISVTCGCAFNFGQVNASGTLNADMKIDTKIDTTVTSSGSIAQITGPGVDTTQQSPGTPSVSATEAPKGSLTVFKDQRLGGEFLGCCGGEAWNNKQEMLLVSMNASKGRVQVVKRIKYTVNNDSQIVNARLYVNGELLPVILPDAPSKIAEFKKNEGLFLVEDGKPAKVDFVTGWSANGDPLLYSQLFRDKKTYVSIVEIETLSGAEIFGLPIAGPETKFGHCLPDDPLYKTTPC